MRSHSGITHWSPSPRRRRAGLVAVRVTVAMVAGSCTRAEGETETGAQATTAEGDLPPQARRHRGR